MKIRGSYFRDGKHWVVDLPAIDATTQAPAKSKIEEMVRDLLSSLANRPIELSAALFGNGKIEVDVIDEVALFPLILRRQREKSGMSQKDAANLLGYASVNAYSAYEQGERQPSLEKAEKLLKAVSKESRIRIDVA